jgi:iron complex outermembrane receptor protein
MKAYLFLFAALCTCGALYSQNTFRAAVMSGEGREPLAGASAWVKGTANGSISDSEGRVELRNIPDGRHTVVFSYTGYAWREEAFDFPLPDGEPVEIFLETDVEEIEEVVVSSMRGTRTIEKIPTRIEFIAGEELDEKSNMKPGDIRMLLNESTGIQTQQTSPLSANAAIRIQGLDGRYTQILKDGLPVYSGAASGLGLLQIPPLDLKQVEIIKGSASTLYGGGAIAGMVNLVSKTPDGERDLNFHVNGTSALGLDLNGFYSERFGRTGVTVFASRNGSAAYDPAGTGFSAIPKVERYSVNPRLFVYFGDATTMELGVNTAFEDRLGGDMKHIRGEGGAESYFEENRTQRASVQFAIEHRFNGRSKLSFRNSYNYFHRVISLPDYTFDGRQHGVFSELNGLYTGDVSEWVGGVNLWTDDFAETNPYLPARDYRQPVFGAFVQNTVQLSEHLSVESGLRGDRVSGYGFALLPRLSALFKIGRKWSSRIGGGMGYKAPTLFTEESERVHYRNVTATDRGQHVLERSYGVNADIDWKTSAGEVSLSVNQLFFYTRLDRPLMLEAADGGMYAFRNIRGYTGSRGAETNVKVRYADFTLFTGYTFTDARVHEEGAASRRNPLTSAHRLNNVAMYEREESWKAGLEAYYYSPQRLNDGSTGRGYWICGLMVEKIWERFSTYINFENFTDTRQTRFGPIYGGTKSHPVFGDIYAPLDGFVVNAGVKIRL